MPQFKTWFQTCGCQVLTIIFTCVHVLEDKVMKDMNLTYTVETLYRKKIKTWKAKSWVGQSLSRLGDMELPKNVTFQDLADQVLKEKCKISDLLLPSLDNHVHLWSRLGRPSHERHNSWQGSNVEILCPKKFQDLSSAIIVKTWGHGVAKKCNISRHGILPSLKKNVRFQNCGCCQVLTIMFTCVHVLEGQVMKGIILGKGLMLKFFAPKGFKTWKAKSWIVQSLSRLRDMELQKDAAVQDLVSDLWLPSLDNHFHLCSCLGRQSHERHESYLYCWNSISQKNQDLESQVLSRAIIVKTWGHGVAKERNVSRLGRPGLERKM